MSCWTNPIRRPSRLFDRQFRSKVAIFDDISAFFPPGFTPPKEEPEAPTTEAAESVAPPPILLDEILGPVEMDDVSAFLLPDCYLDEPTVTERAINGALDDLFDLANLDDIIGWLLPTISRVTYSYIG